MGRGNYYPSVDPKDCFKQVYVDFPDRDEEEDEEENLWQFDLWNNQLRADIGALLPGSFFLVNQWGDHNSFLLCRNGLLDVRMADNEWSEALFVCPRQDWDYYSGDYYIPALAKKHLDLIAKRLFNGLKEKGYKLYVRDGAWTSSEYTPL